MPLMRFISPTDPRWLSTLQAIEDELTVDTLVYRYKTESGVDGCSKAKARLPHALSGSSNASRAQGSWIKRGSCLKRCWDMPTTWDFNWW